MARLLRDARMEVVYVGRFQTPASVAAAAIRCGAHVIGISCHCWEYLEYMPRLLGDSATRPRFPVVIGGSVITAADAERLYAAGVARVFPASARDVEIVDVIRDLALGKPQPGHQGLTA